MIKKKQAGKSSLITNDRMTVRNLVLTPEVLIEFLALDVLIVKLKFETAVNLINRKKTPTTTTTTTTTTRQHKTFPKIRRDRK